MNDYVKIVKWNDGTKRTLAAFAGMNTDAWNRFPQYSGYKLLQCLGGEGNGNTGLLVAPNGWLANTSNVQKTWDSASWMLIYIKI